MRFLGSVGAKAAAPAPPPAPAGAVRRTIPQADYALGRPYIPNSVGADVDRFVRDTYERVTWCFKAVHAVAHNAARLKIVERKDDPETGTDILDHQLLPLLNWRASPYTKEQAYVFRHRVSAQLELSTKGVFIEVIRSRRGECIALHLIPPRTISAVPDPLTFVSHYEVRVGGGAVTAELAPDQVLWLKNPHPIDPYRSMTAFEAAGMAIDGDWLAHLYNANFMRNDGRGSGLIAAKGGLEEEDAEELQSWFSGGVARAGEVRVIEADSLDYVDLATSPRDAQYVEMVGLSKTEIFMAAGVPESVAGNAAGRTWDNAEVEYDIFWNEKMLGHLELVGGGYDLLDNDPTTFTVHDTSKVPALQRADNERKVDMRQEVAAGVRTIDSYLEATGEEPFGVPQTMVPLTGIGVSPLFKVDEQGNYIPPAPPATLKPATADTLPAPAPNGNGNKPPVPEPAPA